MPAEELPPAPAFRSPRYELRAHIGAGNMGTVDRAWDRELLVEVALKRLFARTDAEQLYLLKQEFRALRDLSHRNLARLYDLDVSEGECFFTMELVEGTDFVDFVRGGLAPTATTSVQDDARFRAATGSCASPTRR